MTSYGADEWLQPPRAAAPGGVIGQPPAESHPPQPAVESRSFDLLSPEHRDKLVTMFRWVAEGRTWDEVKGDTMDLFRGSAGGERHGADERTSSPKR